MVRKEGFGVILEAKELSIAILKGKPLFALTAALGDYDAGLRQTGERAFAVGIPRRAADKG